MPSATGLSSLSRHTLSPKSATWLEALGAHAHGSSVWRARKSAEMHDLLALGEIAPPGRIAIEELDPRQALRAMLRLRVPVPVRAGGGRALGGIAPHARLGLVYPQEALRRSLPGFAFVQILSPAAVFHANVVDDVVQLLCLGATLPPGVRVTELVLMAYGALSMQSVMLDAGDAAGVMNPRAASWWLANRRADPALNDAVSRRRRGTCHRRGRGLHGRRIVMSIHHVTTALGGVLGEALAAAGFEPHGKDACWRHGSVTARATRGWLELRDTHTRQSGASQPEASEPRGHVTADDRWTASFRDPAFGTDDPWRHAPGGTRVFEMPAAYLEGEDDAGTLARRIEWALKATRGGSGVLASTEPHDAPPPLTRTYQRGSILRQPELLRAAEVVLLRVPIVTTPIDGIDGVRRQLLAELLGDAARRLRWVRLGVDGDRRPSAEIALPIQDVADEHPLAALAGDALATCLDWIAATAEVVATCEAQCLDVKRGTGNRVRTEPCGSGA